MRKNRGERRKDMRNEWDWRGREAEMRKFNMAGGENCKYDGG